MVLSHDVVALSLEKVVGHDLALWECSDRPTSILHRVGLVVAPAEKSETHHVEEVINCHYDLDEPRKSVEEGENESPNDAETGSLFVVVTRQSHEVEEVLFYDSDEVPASVDNGIDRRLEDLLAEHLSLGLEVAIEGEHGQKLNEGVDNLEAEHEEEDEEGQDAFQQGRSGCFELLLVD